MAYLDASVVLRLVLGEPQRLAERDEMETAVASALTELECLRTLDRLGRMDRHGRRDPRCNARRMAEEAAHLTDEVIPHFPSGSECFPCPSVFGPSSTRRPRWRVQCSPSSSGRSGPRFVRRVRPRPRPHARRPHPLVHHPRRGPRRGPHGRPRRLGDRIDVDVTLYRTTRHGAWWRLDWHGAEPGRSYTVRFRSAPDGPLDAVARCT